MSAGGNTHGSKWIWPATRRRIYVRDRHRCVWCTKDLSRVPKKRRTLDHVVPRAWRDTPHHPVMGTSNPRNLVTACLRCNTKRQGLSALAFAWTHPAPDAVLERLAQAIDTPLPALP